MDRRTAEALVAKAHQVCPYSNATRGNIDVDTQDRGVRSMSASCTALPRPPARSSSPPARPAGRSRRTSALAESTLPDLEDGQVLVRNLFISVDPYMRGRMNDVKSYSAPFALDAALDGGAVGEVIASRADSARVGDVVVHGLGWREHAVVDAARDHARWTPASPRRRRSSARSA